MAVVSFSGLASGIDTTGLIKAMLDAERRVRVTPLEEKRAALVETDGALAELKTKLSALGAAASKFRTLSGGALRKTAVSGNESVVTATAAPGAGSGTYQLSVTSLSRGGTFSFDDRFSSASAPLAPGLNDAAPAADRTVTVTTGLGSDAESVEIELTSSTTAADLAAQFNLKSSAASASVVNLGTAASPSYGLVFSSADEGTARGSVASGVGAAVTAAGLFTSSTVSQAADSVFSMSGVAGSVTRSGRSVSDLVPGVTFELSGTGTATVKVSDDGSETAGLAEELVEAYNDVLSFVKEADTVTRDDSGGDVTNLFGPLASTRLDDSLLGALRGAVAGTRTSGSSLSVLADLGVTTARDGSLSFDRKVFTEGVAKDPAAAERLLSSFAEALAGTSDGVVPTYTRFGGVIDTETGSNGRLRADYSRRLEDAESSLAKQEAEMRGRFARLESLMGRLNSEQSALSALLPR